ncbi:UNVERIFIED_CONTAM: hypothetical protein FKN15_040141 [Acipenser sinensis]
MGSGGVGLVSAAERIDLQRSTFDHMQQAKAHGEPLTCRLQGTWGAKAQFSSLDCQVTGGLSDVDNGLAK